MVAKGEDGKPMCTTRATRLPAVFACLIGFIFCLFNAGRPQIVLDAESQFRQAQAQCTVLGTGMEYTGNCELNEGNDVAKGAYSPCDTFSFCANEGEICQCQGTVRYGTHPDDLIGASEGVLLEQDEVIKNVSGQINCTKDALGEDPAPLRAKYCSCRPEPLRHIKREDVFADSCADVASTHGPVGFTPIQPWMGGKCSDGYRPWALVSVLKVNETNSTTRCAYRYGLSHLSSLQSGNASRDFLAGLKNGTAVPCAVLETDGLGQDLAGNEDCIVALDQGNKTIFNEWSAMLTARVEFRQGVCWLVVGIGFLVIAGILAAVLRYTDAREPQPGVQERLLG